MHYFQKYSTEFQNLYSEIHRFDSAREIHEKLSQLLQDKRVFFDLPREEFKHDEELKEDDEFFRNDKAQPIREIIHETQPRLSSLDIIAYAYLKEELINTPDSKEIIYLKENYTNLVNFVKTIDQLME